MITMQYEDRLSNEMLQWFVIARGSGKYRLAMEKYRKLVGISDKEWEEMKKEAERRDC